MANTDFVIAEYVWIDADGGLRCKARVFDDKKTVSLKDLPDWNFDGSSTGQAPGEDSEVIIKPVAVYHDPFRGGNHVLVLTACYTPAGEPPSKKVVVAVCTQVDLLKYVMTGEQKAGPMKWQPTSSKPPPQPTNRADELSRGRNELDCAQMAWAFMKPPQAHSPPRTPQQPTNHADVELSRGRNELDCAQLAWAFMKPASSPSRSPPVSPSTYFASPMLNSEAGESGLPKLDVSLFDDMTSDDASGQPTRFATPAAAAVVMNKDAVESLKLPQSLAAQAALGRAQAA